MAQPGSLLDTGDKIASIVGAAVAVLGLVVALRSGRERSRGGWTRAAVITLAAVGFALALLLVLPGVPAVVSRAAAWSIVPLLAGMAVLLGRVRRERRRPDPSLTALLEAQRADATRHRYRFFGHVPALTELYVRQRVRLDGRSEGEGSRTINAVQVLRAQRHAVVLGDAGAGKSIFLAMVADELARHLLAGRPTGEFAVSVHASDLASLHLPQALAQAVQRDLDITLPSSTFEKPPAVGRSWRVLVDGLDEVADAHKRSTVLWRIRDLLAADSHYRFLIASRPLTESELLELRGPAVGEYELRPFDRADLAEFAARWFVARHPTDLRRAKQQAALFQARVAGARLGPVARIPLLATIAALVFEQERERALPSSRAALYERFVQHLLNGQPSLARLRQAAEPELLSRGVGGRAVAQWLWSDIDVHVSELLDTCGAAWLADPGVRLTDVAGTWVKEHTRYDLVRVSPDGGQMLRDLLLATGVFTLHRDRVAFAHQSFAEYFAARAGEPTFDPERWRVQAANPATRSLAGFAAARRPDSDRLVTGLLDSANVVAAGDLLADGVPVAAATRTRIVDSLLRQITDESVQAPDALRILGELSVDTDVLARMTGVVLDPDVSVWARAFIADRVADIESAAGIKLLRSLMPHASSTELEWIVNTLEERGVRINPELDLPQPDEAAPDGGKPLGVLGQHALRQRLADVSASDRERLEAARHLADSGDLEPLRAMVDAVDISRLQRVRIAVALADAGDPETLRLLATKANLERWPPADPADGLRASFAAGVDLFGRGDRHALGVLRAIVDEAPDYPMAFGAAAHLADAGDLKPLSKLAQGSGQPQVRIAAARRLAQMGGDVVVLERALNGALRPQAEALIPR
ncbi:NACHT domain-containing protein [Actinoplanes sp. NPDC049599]|uniref:NACHT domain-containing protein n=1 Tax=Actinoplanes sp. NPDC049599 TaxID=3363903 RepID=UPI003789F0FD